MRRALLRVVPIVASLAVIGATSSTALASPIPVGGNAACEVTSPNVKVCMKATPPKACGTGLNGIGTQPTYQNLQVCLSYSPATGQLTATGTYAGVGFNSLTTDLVIQKENGRLATTVASQHGAQSPDDIHVDAPNPSSGEYIAELTILSNPPGSIAAVAGTDPFLTLTQISGTPVLQPSSAPAKVSPQPTSPQRFNCVAFRLTGTSCPA